MTLIIILAVIFASLVLAALLIGIDGTSPGGQGRRLPPAGDGSDSPSAWVPPPMGDSMSDHYHHHHHDHHDTGSTHHDSGFNHDSGFSGHDGGSW